MREGVADAETVTETVTETVVHAVLEMDEETVGEEVPEGEKLYVAVGEVVPQ